MNWILLIILKVLHSQCQLNSTNSQYLRNGNLVLINFTWNWIYLAVHGSNLLLQCHLPISLFMLQDRSKIKEVRLILPARVAAWCLLTSATIIVRSKHYWKRFQFLVTVAILKKFVWMAKRAKPQATAIKQLSTRVCTQCPWQSGFVRECLTSPICLQRGRLS